MATRREVQAILHRHGIQNKFSLRTVGFSDLARCDIQVCDIKDWKAGQADFQAVRTDLKAIHVILQMNVYFG